MIKAVLFDWGGVLIENPDEGLMNCCARHLNTTVSKLIMFWKVFRSFSKSRN